MTDSSPLDATWVERSLSLDLDGQPVRGIARANWGAVEVEITYPVAHLSRHADGRGWAFAMLAHHRPQERYTLGGAFTEKGLLAAQRFLVAIYRDWLAVSRHEAEVDKTCRNARRELEQVRHRFAERMRPGAERRSALRKSFRAGELTQKSYQAAVRELSQERERLEGQQRGAAESIQARFMDVTNLLTGRPISLDTAERMLSEVALVVERLDPERV